MRRQTGCDQQPYTLNRTCCSAFRDNPRWSAPCSPGTSQKTISANVVFLGEKILLRASMRDDDLATELELAGEEDARHPAAAEFALDAVAVSQRA